MPCMIHWKLSKNWAKISLFSPYASVSFCQISWSQHTKATKILTKWIWKFSYQNNFASLIELIYLLHIHTGLTINACEYILYWIVGRHELKVHVQSIKHRGWVLNLFPGWLDIWNDSPKPGKHPSPCEASLSLLVPQEWGRGGRRSIW